MYTVILTFALVAISATQARGVGDAEVPPAPSDPEKTILDKPNKSQDKTTEGLFSSVDFMSEHGHHEFAASTREKSRPDPLDCPQPAGRWLHTATAVGGSIFVFGGVDAVEARAIKARNVKYDGLHADAASSVSSADPTDYLLNDLWSYNVQYSHWTQLRGDMQPCQHEVLSSAEREMKFEQVPQYRPGNVPDAPKTRDIPTRLLEKVHAAAKAKRDHYLYADTQPAIPETLSISTNSVPDLGDADDPRKVAVLHIRTDSVSASPKSKASGTFGGAAKGATAAGQKPSTATVGKLPTKVFLELAACNRYTETLGAADVECHDQDDFLQHSNDQDNFLQVDESAHRGAEHALGVNSHSLRHNRRSRQVEDQVDNDFADSWMFRGAVKDARIDGAFSRAVLFTPSDALWQYDLSSRRWFQPASEPRPVVAVPVESVQSGAVQFPSGALLEIPGAASKSPQPKISAGPASTANTPFLDPDLLDSSLSHAPRPLHAPAPRFLHAAAAMNRGIVVVGGVATHSMEVLGDVWHFDPEPPIDVPDTAPQTPFARPMHGRVWRRMWPAEEEVTDAVKLDKSDPMGPFTPKQHNGAFSAAEGHSAVVVRSSKGPLPSRSASTQGNAQLDDVSTLPLPGSGVANEVLLVFGGLIPDNNHVDSGANRGLVWAFSADGAAAGWQNHTIADLSVPVPTNRWLHAATTVTLPVPQGGKIIHQDYMLIFGGCSFDTKPLADVWLYHYATNTWKELQPAGYGPSPRWLTSVLPIEAPHMPPIHEFETPEVAPGSIYEKMELMAHPEHIIDPASLSAAEAEHTQAFLKQLIAEKQEMDTVIAEEANDGGNKALRFQSLPFGAGSAQASLSNIGGAAAGKLGAGVASAQSAVTQSVGNAKSSVAGGAGGGLLSKVKSSLSGGMAALKAQLSSGLSALKSSFSKLGGALGSAVLSRLKKKKAANTPGADPYAGSLPLPAPPSKALLAQIEALEYIYSNMADAETPPIDIGDWSGGESAEFIKQRASLGLDADSFAALQRGAIEQHTPYLVKEGLISNSSGSASPLPRGPAAAAFLEVEVSPRSSWRGDEVDAALFRLPIPAYATSPDVAYGKAAANKPALYIVGGTTTNGVAFSDHFILHYNVDLTMPAVAGFPVMSPVWEQLLDTTSGPAGRVGAAAVVISSPPDDAGIAGLTTQPPSTAAPAKAPASVGKQSIAGKTASKPATAGSTGPAGSTTGSAPVVPQWILLFGGAERDRTVLVSDKTEQRPTPLGSRMLWALSFLDTEELELLGK